MAYNCGNCAIEFKTKRELVEHMIEKHDSPFYEGDYAQLSQKILNERSAKGDNKAKAHLQNYE